MYQAEITAPAIRGRMTSLQQWVRISAVLTIRWSKTKPWFC